jgi:hypothetical protein
MMQDPHDKLDERLAQLPRQVALPRSLWPGIAREIERRPRRAGALAVAASLLLVPIAGTLLWIALHASSPPAGVMSPANPPAAARRPVSFDEPRDAVYMATRASLERSFRERLALLDPATRAKIETSLAQIRAAHEQIRQALAAQPANPVLEHLLDSMLHDEFDLYDSVVEATQPSMVRS